MPVERIDERRKTECRAEKQALMSGTYKNKENRLYYEFGNITLKVEE
jgi:hypothetical protein